MRRLDICVDEVKTRENGRLPYLIRVDGNILEVRRVIDVWRKETGWWKADGGERRDLYPCLVTTGDLTPTTYGVVELYRVSGGEWEGKWSLAKIADYRYVRESNVSP